MPIDKRDTQPAGSHGPESAQTKTFIETALMKLGFIGTGALTSAIVTGLKSVADNSVSVVLSPRNASTSADLASRYRDVHVAADNQAVLDDCDTVMLAVRSPVAREVLPDLRFRPDHHVVSLIATLSRDEVSALIQPGTVATKALPMPMIAHRQGATIICPPDPPVTAFFERLGKVIEVASPAEFDALSVVTATYAAYFMYLDTALSWLQGHGIDEAQGRDYIATLFGALGNAPRLAPGTDFMELANEYATRGGINEQVLRELIESGVFDALAQSLDGVYRRIRREPKG